MFNITELRKRFPAQNLGYRERSILFAKGAKVSKTTTLGMYKVMGKDSYFEYTFNCRGYKDFTVVG